MAKMPIIEIVTIGKLDSKEVDGVSGGGGDRIIKGGCILSRGMECVKNLRIWCRNLLLASCALKAKHKIAWDLDEKSDEGRRVSEVGHTREVDIEEVLPSGN